MGSVRVLFKESEENRRTGKRTRFEVPHRKTTAEKDACQLFQLWKCNLLFVFSCSRDRRFLYRAVPASNAVLPQCFFIACLLKAQWRCMQPKHTEPLFIPTAVGLLQGHDPEGLKNQAAIELTLVTQPGVKSPRTRPNTCVLILCL